MKYRFDQLNHVTVEEPEFRIDGRLWCCQIFRVYGADTPDDAMEKLRRMMEHQFQLGCVSISMMPHPVRTSAPYFACEDPVVMVLRSVEVRKEEEGWFAGAEVGLIERADIYLGATTKGSRFKLWPLFVTVAKSPLESLLDELPPDRKLSPYSGWWEEEFTDPQPLTEIFYYGLNYDPKEYLEGLVKEKNDEE